MKSVQRIIPDPSVLAGKSVIKLQITVDLDPGLHAPGRNESTILDEYSGLERENILTGIRTEQAIVRKAGVYHTASGKDNR